MATYYIDFVSGSPTGAGTPADPYKDWDDVPALSNNDIVRFKRGVTHAHDQWIAPGVCDEVTFEAYYNSDGSDDTTQPKPILTNSSPTLYHVFHIANTTNRTNMTLRNLVMRDSTLNANARNLNVATSDYTAVSGLIVEDCEFYNASLNNIRLMAGHCTIRRCIIDQSDDDNIYTEGEYNEFYDNRITRPSQGGTTGDNIQIASSVHTTPNNYTITNNYMDASDGLKQTVIAVGVTHTISENTCISGLFGINLTASCLLSNVTGNTVYSSASATRLVNVEGGSNKVTGNLLIRNHNAGTPEGMLSVNAGVSVSADRNTIIDNTGTDYCFRTLAAASGVTVRNSILKGGLEGIRRGTTAITEANNRFFNNAENYTLSGTPQTIDASSENLTTDPLDSEYLPLPNSSCIGQATRTWSGTNPIGFNGEPYSDYDTDIGGAQTTYSPFHPVNL